MPEVVKGVDVSEPGFITIATSSGPPTRYPVSDLLRAADIPVGLTHTQVAGITYLANLVVILIRTLIERGVLDETFADGTGEDYDLDWDLDHLIYVVEQLGGTYREPHFDHVEDA